MREVLRKTLSPRYRWILIGVLWLVVIVLGVGGYAEQSRDAGDDRGPFDFLYLTLQLLTLDYDGGGELNWRLQVARFVAPIVAASTLLQAAAVLFRDQLALTRLRFVRDHVVVAGLGREGTRLVAGFAAMGKRVVAIEVDPSSPGIAPARARAATVIVGSATDAEVLAQARLAVASEIVVVCGGDGVNAEVAALVRGVDRPPGSRPLRCAVQLMDAELCGLLRHYGLREDDRVVRLEFFNVYQAGARAWVAEHPFTQAAPGGRRPHLVVIGLGQLGRSLAVAATQRWVEGEGADGSLLRLTLVDRVAGGRFEAMRLRHPALDDHCEAHPIDLDFGAPDPRAVERLAAVLRYEHPSAIYIGFDDDSRALATGLLVRRMMGAMRAPVVLRTTSDAGLGSLVSTRDRGPFDGLHLFPLLERTCTPEAIQGGVHEQLARAIHDDYVARTLRGEGPPGPLAKPWEQLPEPVRESNLRAAGEIAEGLDEVGCELVPSGRWDEAAFAFTAGEVEALAQREHGRWSAERRRDGWRHGPVRDDAKRLNPLLVPWAELADGAREYNREAIRDLPAMLARAGFEVIRPEGDAVVPPAPPPAPQRAGAPLAANGAAKERRREAMFESEREASRRDALNPEGQAELREWEATLEDGLD